LQQSITVIKSVAGASGVAIQIPSARLIAPSTWILAAMGILDLTMTVCLLTYTEADEANPLMSRFLSFGIGAFILAKLASLILPLAFIEFARRRRPLFVQRATICGIAAYGALLLAGIAHFNYPRLDRPDLGNDYVRTRIAAARSD
jgi:hypothetical protein